MPRFNAPNCHLNTYALDTTLAPQEEADAEWEDLHERWSPHVLESMRKLQGFYIKVGQVLAGRTDTLPPQYTDKLRTLEDACPPRPLEGALLDAQ